MLWLGPGAGSDVWPVRHRPPSHPTLTCRHLGVVKALLEHNLLPRVVSGSSSGSIGEPASRPACQPEACQPAFAFFSSALVPVRLLW